MYIIAGSNGSGKTTFAREYLPNYAKCNNFVNADLIAQGLSPFSPVAASIKAGRLLLERVHQFVERKMDFAIESTLSGKTYTTILKSIKEKGYSIHIFYLWIPDIRLAKARIKQRVQDGGHDVPEGDVTRRFKRSSDNFVEIYKPLCDSWIIFDNSSERSEIIAHEEMGKLVVVNGGLYNTIFKEKV